MKRAALYICYYNVTEPLVHTQVVAYLGELAKRGIEMHLLTFERERHSVERELEITEDLRKRGIQWHWLLYHQRPSLPATVYDIVIGTAAALNSSIHVRRKGAIPRSSLSNWRRASGREKR